MSAPFHNLKHEHRVIEQALRALEGIRLLLQTNTEVPVEDISQLVEFINRYAGSFHHVKEEKYLFPALQKLGIPWENGALGKIEHEHKVERDLVSKLENSVEVLRKGSQATVKLFIDAANRYSKHLLGHMQHEDAILFRLAEEMMNPDEQEVLFQDFKRAEIEFGVEALKRYEALANSLAEKWAV